MTDKTPHAKGLVDEAIDPFFHLEPGGAFNACVGRQGTEENYMDGYMQAAQELVSAVLDKQQYEKRDTLAMPILYNARHALELTLKYLGRHLHALGRLAEKPQENHDIEGLWGALAKRSLGDEFVNKSIADLGAFVASLATIDEDGQELRYAVNRDGHRSMQTYSLVDLELVKYSLDHLAQLISNLKYRVLDMHEERRSGTWTDECSRSDLLEISKLLPPRHEWGSQAFTDAKTVAMERFGLSGRKFSEAVKKVEESRECRSHIGLESGFAHLSGEHIILAIREWCTCHPPRNSDEDHMGVVYPRKRLFAKMREWDESIAGALVRLLAALSEDEIADLEALFYIGREQWMPEFYPHELERIKAEHAAAGNTLEELRHLLTKTNFAEEVCRGVYRVGQRQLADDIRGMLARARGPDVNRTS